MLKSYFGIIFFSPRCRLIIYRTFYSETCEYYQFGIKERRDFIVKKTGKKTMPMFIHGDGNWSNLEIFFNNICRISLNISVKSKKLYSKKKKKITQNPLFAVPKLRKKSGLTLSLNKHSHKSFLGQLL
jgi:hypothetical protein